MSAPSASAESSLSDSLRARGLGGARVAIVAGSGLGALAQRIESGVRVEFAALAGMPASGVAGHAGAFVRGRLAGVEVLMQLGRAHLYEGHSAQVVARALRAVAVLGVRGVLLTNSAGSLHREWGPGTLMRIIDHVNQQRATPLERGEGGYGTPWDAEWGARLDAAAVKAGIALERGVYAGLVGPRYETPAEIALLARLGVHAVGMSTVQEALAAHAAGLRVAGVSLLANLGAGLADAPLAHEDVLAAGEQAAPRLARLLEAALPLLAED